MFVGQTEWLNQVPSEIRLWVKVTEHCEGLIATISDFVQSRWVKAGCFVILTTSRLSLAMFPKNNSGQEQLYRTLVGSQISVQVPPLRHRLFLQQSLPHVTSPTHGTISLLICWNSLIRKYILCLFKRGRLLRYENVFLTKHVHWRIWPVSTTCWLVHSLWSAQTAIGRHSFYIT